MSLPHIDRRSLRFRLFAWLGGMAVIAVGVTWLLHGILLRDLARDFLGDRLRQEAQYTLQRIRQEPTLEQPWLKAGSLVSQVFHHFYVLRLGDQTVTSHPAWLDRLEPYLDTSGDPLVDVHWQNRHLLVLRAPFSAGKEEGVLLIGEDFAQVEAGLARLHWWVGSIAGLVLLLLIVLNLVAVNAGLRPLKHLQRQLGELQAGRRERLQLKVPSELDHLVGQLNRFLDAQDERLKRSRDALANLSHALKTPLAAITQVMRGSRPIDESRRRKILTRLQDMHAQLEAELRRSRIAGPHTGQHTRLHHETQQLIEMFTALYPEKRFHLDAKNIADTTLSVERQDFTEMLGIILDNASKWAHREIRCTLSANDALTLIVEDDGPGVPAQDIPRLGQRGLRLDQGRPGHGLGLSILVQLVAQYAGRLEFAPSPLGGLCVKVQLPLA